ncbi:uncharacterized protein LOC128987803 [Macrosteles quadrilineatus]|uniref:uncharacterized protein LOC128987803 n=1 Tax=Macrosteles quadrilineatus TaxID=74068 RepID=UPI0023E18D3B|nr:uncharacterized protein LOC128987803 [Macrosteles quadrilineatus]
MKYVIFLNAVLAFCALQVLSQDMNMNTTLVMSGGANSSIEGTPCRERMRNMTMKCAKDTGATQDDVDIAMRMEIPTTDTGKCLIKCLLKGRGMMTPEGAFAPNTTAEFLTMAYRNETLKEEFKQLANYCYEKLKMQPMSNLDSCEFAYDIATCTEEYQKSLFLRNPAMAPPVNAITTP